MASRGQIELLEKGPDLAAIPLSRIGSLLTFHQPPVDHRVHLQGTVTYQMPGAKYFCRKARRPFGCKRRTRKFWSREHR